MSNSGKGPFCKIKWDHSIPELSGTVFPPERKTDTENSVARSIPLMSEHDLETEIIKITISYLWSSYFRSRDRGIYFPCSNVWKWRQSQMWSTSVGTHSTQRHCLFCEWCRSVSRQCTFLLLFFSWKPGCHCSCYQNTFSAKTVQHSTM